jgi:NTE family protein
MSLRKIEHFWLRPSIDIGHLASGQFDQLPPVIRYLLGGLGSSRESSEITSYLLFEPEFCAKLVEIGYNDTHAQATELKTFLNS